MTRAETPAPGPGPAVRDAATVMIVRDGPAGMEVFMQRRNPDSAFVPNAYVFPGGAVDPGDRGPGVEAACPGRSDAEASEVLGVASGGLAYWVAAIRECFEEAGLLLAYGPGGDALVGMGEEEVAGRYARYRGQVDAGSRSLVELCRDEGLTLAVDRIHYFSHWITPEGAPRRYDTRFFVTAAPTDQVPSHDNREAVADVWLRPADALGRNRAGELALILPTLRNLVAISRFSRSADLLAHAAAIGLVPAILPRLVADEHGTRIVLPGDPLYDRVGDGAGAGTGWPDGMPLPGLVGGPEVPEAPGA